MPQDERYFRQIFSGELNRSDTHTEDKKYSYQFHGPYYALDLNRDGIPEKLLFVKKDSEDWLEIYEQKNGDSKKLVSFKFDTLGFDSELYRIELKKISTHTNLILLYYYEGISRYTELKSTSRIYIGTIDDGDLKTISIMKGPSIFEEHKALKGHYHLRNYQVVLEDLNNDNIKELIIKYHLTSQVFMYNGDGKWKTFRN